MNTDTTTNDPFATWADALENTLDVLEGYRRQGIGSLLLTDLVAQSEQHGIWTLQAGIFPENVPSVELHKRHGFRIVGTREKLGSMDGRWRDILLLERRSSIAGV